MRYRTIVADPPWHYDAMPVGGSKAGTLGSSRSLPYETMTLAEIAALPVGDIAEKDATLWLWTTNRWLPDSFSIVKSWGFQYRQTIVWGKNNPLPVGAVAPSAAEFLLYCRRGRPLMTGRAFSSSVVVTSRPAARSHSTKPDCFLDGIEAVTEGPRVEMFSRRQRLGWDTWGHEALNHLEMPA